MKRTRLPSRGLYAITDNGLHTGPALEQAVMRAIAGGARVIQYRDKTNDTQRRFTEAVMLVRICRRHGVPMIVNDDVELALACDADGVHVGRGDVDLSEARARLRDDFIIGVSCYDQPLLAETARDNGADYVAFGSMFPSTTKPGATRAGLSTIERAREKIDLPIVAIGGITPENGGSLLEAGADMLAVVRGVFAHPDPAEAAQRYAGLFVSQTQDETL